MMSRKIMELVGKPVKLMNDKKPMIPFLASGGSVKMTVEFMAPIRNRNLSILSISISGLDIVSNDRFEFEAIIETVYTRKQVFSLLKGADAIYVLSGRLYIVDACGNCKCVPHVSVRSFSRTHRNEEMTRLVNGVEFH